MTGLDIEAIRQRGMVALSIEKPMAGAPIPPAAALAALYESAEDVPALLAEVERLRGEVFTLTDSEDAMLAIVRTERDVALREVKKLREWNSEIKAERDALALKLLGIEEGT